MNIKRWIVLGAAGLGFGVLWVMNQQVPALAVLVIAFVLVLAVPALHPAKKPEQQQGLS